MNDKRSVFQQSFSEKKSNFISLSWEVKTVQSDFEHPKELRTQGVSDSQHLYPGNIGLLLLPDHQISLFGVQSCRCHESGTHFISRFANLIVISLQT